MLPLVTKGQILLDLPDPIIVLVGPTGSGKSSLANALLGCDPKSSDCLFQVCHDMDSCTKETTYGTGRWLGIGDNFTVVDSPGFGDSDGEDSVLVEEMVTVLKDTIKHSSTILLVLKGTETRFNDALQDMLTQMSMIFGDQWWNYMVVGVSFWKLDQESIDEREGNCEHYPDSCKNEEWFMREINAQLEEKFHVKRNLTYVFIDSYSQAWPDNEDQVQQDHFQAETGVLWKETMSRNSTIFFKGIDDVLHENYEMKEKIKWLEEVITNNITELMSRMEANEENDSKLSQNLLHLEDDLIPGIGSIIPWIPNPDGPGASLQTKIPTGWQKCDGSQILSGPLINLRTPNLNGKGLFLRGGDDSHVTAEQEDMVLDHAHIDPGHSHTDSGHTHTQESHKHGTDHFPNFNPVGAPETEMYLNADNGPINDWFAHWDSGTTSSTPRINSASASIHSSKSGVSTVADHYKKGHENRPKNMVVTYIMRIF